MPSVQTVGEMKEHTAGIPYSTAKKVRYVFRQPRYRNFDVLDGRFLFTGND